jgi:DNA-binding NarL/FixJ family response regulator
VYAPVAMASGADGSIDSDSGSGSDSGGLADWMSSRGQADGSDAAIRILLADDHAALREGLAMLLRSQPDFVVIGQAVDGAMAVEMARTLEPDVVLMDVSMPVMSGIEATRIISREKPHIRVLGLSMHDDLDMGTAMRRAGATDYLAKDGPLNVLINTIRRARGNRPSDGGDRKRQPT